MDNEFAQDPTLVNEFLVESEELLQHLDQDLIALEATPDDAELLNRIFRAMHTIKGTSGFLGFEPIVRLSHGAEDILNGLRRHDLKLTPPIMDVLLRSRDELVRMLGDLREGGLKSYALEPLLAELATLQKDCEVPLRLGEILVSEKVIPPEILAETLAEQASPGAPKKLGDILINKGLASREEIGNALVQQKQVVESRDQSLSSQTMRVDVRKLDELVNLIGELVLERNRLTQLSRDLGAGRINLDDLNSAFGQSTARLSFITEELQVAGLKTRMIPIGSVFRKFPRLVRDVAHSLQKHVDLVLAGEETELDKTMVELIGDPLVHLVRNSLDHGLEAPAVRTAAGKAGNGTIRIEARQEGDQIVISVSDDGAGIDPERILRKAIEKGLVTPEHGRDLSTKEIFDFVFLPGFSTAEKCNDLSGRGVGMDVVRTNLKKLNGTVELNSRIGCGTTVLLRLPLTLAILPVLLVRVAEEIYALPLRSVLDTTRIESREIHLVEGNEVLRLRDQTIPLLRLHDLFGCARTATDTSEHRKVVILGVDDQRVALLVDDLVAQESTVIKPLANYLHHCSTIAGATISGDGRVRLVLDPAGLLTFTRRTAQECIA
jgi:two-component system chemotaxis sensor kinase CheA